MRRRAPASRPSGRYTVGLRPSLDPDAYLGAHTTRRRRPKKGQRYPLTGPAPSGMTWPFVSANYSRGQAVAMKYRCTHRVRAGRQVDQQGGDVHRAVRGERHNRVGCALDVAVAAAHDGRFPDGGAVGMGGDGQGLAWLDGWASPGAPGRRLEVIWCQVCGSPLASSSSR